MSIDGIEALKFEVPLPPKSQRIVNYLEEQALDKGLDGRLYAVIVKTVDRVNIYPVGERLNDGNIHHSTGLSMGDLDKDMRTIQSPRNLEDISSYQMGHFTSARPFGGQGYVAMINFETLRIDQGMDEDAIKFP